MESEDIILIAVGIGAAYLISKKLKPKTEVSDFSGVTPSGFQTIEQSVFDSEVTNIRIENKGQLTTYTLPNNLSWFEKHLLKIGAYDIEDDKLQWGLHQGVERKIRNWWQIWTTK